MNKENPVLISPFHDIPNNSTNVEYDRSKFANDGNVNTNLGEITVTGPPLNTTLSAPGSIVLKSHVVRTAADGTQIVDVTFEVADVADATGYNIRTTQL